MRKMYTSETLGEKNIPNLEDPTNRHKDSDFIFTRLINGHYSESADNLLGIVPGTQHVESSFTSFPQQPRVLFPLLSLSREPRLREVE